MGQCPHHFATARFHCAGAIFALVDFMEVELVGSLGLCTAPHSGIARRHACWANDGLAAGDGPSRRQ